MYKISIIIPAYNEAESIFKLYSNVMESIEQLLDIKVKNYEIIFINDGSTDETKDAIRMLCEKDKNVHLLSFRKNFGKAAALDAGFHHAEGDIVFTMDADLQDDPAEFLRFIEKIEDGYDLVVGWKYNRLDTVEKRWPSKLFNRVTSFFSGVHLHDHDCGFKAFRREIVKSLDLYGELHRYIPVLAYRSGFRITEITVTHHKREYGRSKYGAERYMRGLFDFLATTFLLRYGDRPMYFFGKVGIAFFGMGLLICLYLTYLRLSGEGIGNRPLLILGVLCIVFGIQSISTGFLGNLLVDMTHRDRYNEYHIEEII